MLSFTLANKSRSRILQQRLSVPVMKEKANFSLFQFPEQDKTFEVVVAPTKVEGKDLSKENLNGLLQPVWEKTQQSLFCAVIIFLSKVLIFCYLLW